MKDIHNREINYLRLSVTDLCDLRCIYCMPEEGIDKIPHNNILTFEEIEEIVRIVADLGVHKVRITGGEPLIRKSIETLIEKINHIPGITDIGLTTNATLLSKKAKALYEAGVKRINVSLDTLNEKKYKEITRTGNLADALQGIEAAREAGFEPIKINTVLIGGVNDDEILDFVNFGEEKGIHVRFIEIMPIGLCDQWNKERFISNEKVLEAVPDLEYVGEDGVARIYQRPGSKMTVGLISPISSHFCPDCNKIRITADGKLKPCLHSADEIQLKGKTGAELKTALINGIEGKPYAHKIDAEHMSDSRRGMSSIGG